MNIPAVPTGGCTAFIIIHKLHAIPLPCGLNGTPEMNNSFRNFKACRSICQRT